MADISITNDGSVFIFTPLSDAGREWIKANVQAEPYQWLGSSLVVDQRFAGDLAEGMLSAGLEVE